MLSVLVFFVFLAIMLSVLVFFVFLAIMLSVLVFFVFLAIMLSVLVFFVFLAIMLSVLRLTESDYPLASSHCSCWVLSRRHIKSTLRQWKEKMMRTDIFAPTDHSLKYCCHLRTAACCVLHAKNLAFARHKALIYTSHPNGELSLFIRKWFQRYNL